MCVTNIAKRRPAQTVALPSSMVSRKPSLISQRLLGNFLPLMQNAGNLNGQSSTVSTAAAPCETMPQQYTVAPGSFVSRTHDVKPKPKRRRKPQKPGKTAKQNDRHFVVHNYHDHAGDPDENDDHEEAAQRRRGGVAVSFPLKLHAVLDQVEADGLAHIVSWQPHGRCFVIHRPKEFVDHVMPNYFRQTKLTSFQRQLNLYGFCRLTRGQDSGGYYHELFLRGKEFLCKRMTRTKVKGTRFKAASSPEQEPDFYSMNPVVVTPPCSDDSSGDEGNAFATRVVSRRRDPPDQLFADPPLLSFNVEPTPVTVDPVLSPAMAQLDAYPMLSSVSTSNIPMNRSVADSILDEAVEELFLNDPMVEQLGDLNVWDSTTFGEDAVQNDTQLGFLLEQLLAD